MCVTSEGYIQHDGAHSRVTREHELCSGSVFLLEAR